MPLSTDTTPQSCAQPCFNFTYVIADPGFRDAVIQPTIALEPTPASDDVGANSKPKHSDDNDTPKLKYTHISCAPVKKALMHPFSTVEQLKQGIIKTDKSRAGSAYTILLFGEVGVGKSSALEFIANVMLGNSAFNYDFSILDRENESGGSQSGSQTNAAHLYHFTSKNGQEV
jgi:hypothetical protein